MLETHRQSIMWQQTWLFDYYTRWHAAQHAIRFGYHFLSFLQIITSPVCRWIAIIVRKLLSEKKIAHGNSDINKRNSIWSDIHTKNWNIQKNAFYEEQKKTKNKNTVCCSYCPERFHKALWIRRWLKLFI